MEKEIKQTQIKMKDVVYNFLVEFIKKNGYAPCLKEICAGTYLSSTTNLRFPIMLIPPSSRI